MSRRSFLKGGSITVAAAGLVSAVPGLGGFLSEASTEAPGVEEVAAGSTAESGALSESIVVHLKDLQTGEMSIYSGEREFVYRDTQLASRIAKAVR